MSTISSPAVGVLFLTAVLLQSELCAMQSTQGPTRRDWVQETPDGSVTRSEWGWGLVGPTQALHATAAPSSLVWSLPSDGSWIAEAVAIGGHGTRVAAHFGAGWSHTLLLSAHDADPPVPVWADDVTVQSFQRQVRAAESSDTIVTLLHEPASQPGSAKRAVLRKYGLGGSQPEWVYLSDDHVPGNQSSSVRVSDDGQTIALVLHAASAGGARLTAFGPDSSSPFADFVVPTSGPFQVFDLSADGSTAVLGSTLKLAFADVASGTVLHQELLFGSPQHGALSVSGDGSVVAFGTLHAVRVYQRASRGGYELAFVHPLPPATYARRVALSADGSTLAMGIHQQGDALTARLAILDVASQSTLVDTTWTGAGAQQNFVSSLSLSDDGERVAAGLWGDEAGIVPQVLVFQRSSPEPLLAAHLPGSVLSLELSATGQHLAVASKGVHANVLGGGGAYWLFEVGGADLSVVGVPSVGSTVTVRQRARAGNHVQILAASSLAGVPAPLPELGYGLLHLDPDGYFALGAAVAGSEHHAEVAVPIPLDSALVGKTLFLQGHDLTDGRLGKSWVALTYLP